MRKLEWTPVSSQTITHLIVMSSLFMMIAGCIQPTPIGPKPINAAADASASASATPTPTDSATPPPPPPAVAPTPSPSSSPSATPVVVASPTSGILTGSATPTQNTCVTYTATVDQNALTDIAIAMSSNSGHVTLFTDTTCSTGSGASVNLTIPTGSASVQFSMTDTNSEAVTLSAAATGGLVGTVTKDITVGVAHLNISVAAATAKSNVCLGPFTVEAQNAGNTPITMNPTLSVTLAGAGLGGTFYTDACSTPAAGSAITIANGANSGTFYYKSTGSGARSLTASAASGVILSNTLAATVTPSKFVVTVVAASFDNATCGGPFTITSQDSTSTTANATSTLTVDLSQTGGAHGVFYSDNVCSAGISSRTITAGTSTATFYYKDTTASETPTLTAADHAGSLTSGTVGVTITAQIINIIQSGLALNLDASLGDGSGFVGAGCGTTTWKDLISSTNATLSNFAGCDGTTGWNGTGTANDPYRLNFPGNTDDHVQFPTISLPSGVTAEAWIYPTNTTMDGFIVEKTAVNAEWELFISTSQLIWRGGSSTLEVHAPAPSANAWHHVVGTQSGTTAAIYIDGVLAASGTVAAIPNGTGTIQVGNFEAGSYYFSGGIAAVRVYSGKFLANQVARNCNAQKSHFSGVTCPTMTTPSTITITHGYMGLNKNTCAALDIVLKDGSGNLSERMSATQIDLSNNGSAIYYSDSNCATPITSTIIPDGLNTKTIYIKDTTAETPTLTAADHAGSLTPGTVALMVTTPIPLLAGFFGSTMAVINGKAYCMGTNFYGACGVGAYVDAPLYSPVAVNNVTRVTALMSTDGGASVHCLVDDGKAKCMGYGVMGDGKTEGCAYGTTCTALSPVQVSGLDASGGSSTITTQVAGSSNSTFCALTQNGAVRCWGNNVGDGSTTFSLTPVATTLTSGVTKIAGSRSNVMAVQNGALYYWGDTLLTPTLVTTYDGSTAAKTVVDVAGSNNQNNAGGERFCAVTADGGASCQDGLLILPAGSGASKIVAGASHFCVVYTGGVRCANTRGGQYWSPVGDISLGDNVTYNPGRSGDATHFITDISQAIGLVQIGQSGTHNNDGVGSPSTFASTDILAIGTGYEHVCVITAGNMMSCWGVNHYGEMGTGSTDNTEYRVAIPTVTAWP